MCSSSAAAREPEPAKVSPTATPSNNKSVPTKMTSSSFAARQLAAIALLGGMSALAYSHSDSFSCNRYITNAIVEPILIPLLGGPTPRITSPQSFFETCLVVLLVPGILIFAHQNLLPFFIATIFCGGTSRRDIDNMSTADQMVHEQNTNKPPAISTFQLYYLPVFWLLRTSFWMSGPYFFPVYASKLIDGQPISYETIGHIFHFGFGMAALLLPVVASMVSASYTDERSGTIAAAIFYGLGALSVSMSLPQQYATGTNILTVLFAGRASGSIGTGLLNVMPEAWLSSEIQKSGADPYGRWLSTTFATAYAFDSIVAIGAGRMASWAADKFDGPTGPFRISPLFLVVAMVIVAMFWTDSDVPVPKKKNGGADDAENNKDGEKGREEDDNDNGNGLSLQGAIRVILSDTKIILIGSVQCLFEAAMYIFVLNQAPTIKAAASKFFAADNDSDDGADVAVPSGIVFGCFMACCLLGSNLFGYLTDKCRCRPERIMTVVQMIAAAALAVASQVVSGTAGDTSLLELCAAFFVFELCVGIYYPSISWLRSKYLPVAHRSIIMTIVAVPFNLLVLSISLSTRIIGVTGAWATASVLLLLATVCLIQLQRIARREAVANLPKTWKRVRAKWVGIARVMQIRKMVQGIAKQATEEDYE